MYKWFNGKKYMLTRQVDTKQDATLIAKDLREMGYLARIVKTDDKYKYHVYRRAKRS